MLEFWYVLVKSRCCHKEFPERGIQPCTFRISQRNLEEHSLTFFIVTEEQKVSGAPQTGPPKEAVGKWSTDHVGKKSPGVELNSTESIIRSSVEAGHCRVFLVFVGICYFFENYQSLCMQ